MKVILTKNVPKLGNKYDIKDVSSGHAMNLLIPQGLAIPATHDAIKKVKSQKDKIEGETKVQLELLADNLRTLDDSVIIIQGKANEKGHLFAGIHAEEIVNEISKQTHIQISANFLDLPHPLKTTGEHLININKDHLSQINIKSAIIKVNVISK